MAREVRVGVAKQSPVEPDFPITIFVESQTSPTSTGLTNFSFTSRYIKKNPPPHHISFLHGYTDEKFLRSFFQKATVSPSSARGT